MFMRIPAALHDIEWLVFAELFAVRMRNSTFYSNLCWAVMLIRTFGLVLGICSVATGVTGGQQVKRMSPSEQEHAIGLLRAAYAAFNRNDIAAAVSQLAPNIDWTEPKEFPGGGQYQGRAEVADYLANSRAQWAEGASVPEGFVLRDNRVVVMVHARFRLKGSKDWMEVRLADVYTFHNGTPVQMRAFADRKAALRWADGDK